MVCTGNMSRDDAHSRRGMCEDVGKYGDESYDMYEVKKIDSDSDSSSESVLPRLILKKIGKNEPAESEIDPVLRDFQSDSKVQSMDIDTASQERSEAVVPFKKRRFKGLLVDEHSVRNISTEEETQVLKQSIAVEEAHKSEAMSCDESGIEKERQDKKEQQQPKAELPQPTNEPSSSQMMHAPYRDGALAGTSGTGFVSSTQLTSHPQEFWINVLKKNFNELDSAKRLQATQFTEEQNEILDGAFVELSRSMGQIVLNSTRSLKTHKCKLCEFSIGHQCMPLDFFRYVRFGAEFMDEAYFAPSEIVVCNCGFAFCHTHIKRLRASVVRGIPGRLTYCLREYNRSVDVSCAKCFSTVVMTNRSKEICCDVNTWDGITNAHRQTFYDHVKSNPICRLTDRPSLDNFYACSKGCCLTYHHCFGTDEVPGALTTSPG
ncbi:c12.1 [Ichnoviriform fugitivi]|uniref:C12.1 n=1 Tax=Ichnoviriform fugitivi TaxID=265522 RepID=Q6Q6F9_9VIRU|nr:c12.1 [Ichnoviriform fugitivi]AAS68099.1 c12.1 [Ichnoviriform fugitivi]